MYELKILGVVVFLVAVLILSFIGRNLMKDYKLRIGNQAPYRKFKSILGRQVPVIENSKFRKELQGTIADNYRYVLDILCKSKDPDLQTPIPHIVIVNYPVLRDKILPYLANKTYHDMDSMDRTLMRLIDSYNSDTEALLSVSDLLVMIIRATPPNLYGNHPEIVQQLYL